MPVAIAEVPPGLNPPIKLWTRAECETLSPGLMDHLELIEGALINRMGKNFPHSVSAMRIMKWLVAVFTIDQLAMECCIDLAPEDNPRNEPVPDLIVLN